MPACTACLTHTVLHSAWQHFRINTHCLLLPVLGLLAPSNSVPHIRTTPALHPCPNAQTTSSGSNQHIPPSPHQTTRYGQERCLTKPRRGHHVLTCLRFLPAPGPGEPVFRQEQASWGGVAAKAAGGGPGAGGHACPRRTAPPSLLPAAPGTMNLPRAHCSGQAYPCLPEKNPVCDGSHPTPPLLHGARLLAQQHWQPPQHRSTSRKTPAVTFAGNQAGVECAHALQATALPPCINGSLEMADLGWTPACAR